MSLKTRLAFLEAVNYEQELDRYARFLVEHHHGGSVADVRQQIKELVTRRKAEGTVLSPEELKQAEDLGRQVDAWEERNGRDRSQQASH
jgi:hypothetical protein